MKHSRQFALEKNAAEMQVERFRIPEVKAKINNIRSTYCQEVKKINASTQSETSSDSIYKPTAVWHLNVIDYFFKKIYNDQHSKI